MRTDDNFATVSFSDDESGLSAGAASGSLGLIASAGMLSGDPVVSDDIRGLDQSFDDFPVAGFASRNLSRPTRAISSEVRDEHVTSLSIRFGRRVVEIVFKKGNEEPNR